MNASRFFILLIIGAFIVGLPSCKNRAAGTIGDIGLLEICDNRVDDDADGTVDCQDTECKDFGGCIGQPEACTDGLDNDLDDAVDCTDTDCTNNPVCSENCSNGVDDNGDNLADCDDPICKGMNPICGEVCGDGVDNDQDNLFDCLDPDCFSVIPPCGGAVTSDGTICAYGGSVPHTCTCADGNDNDFDGAIDTQDLQCFGPYDDDESSYATGIPGDNNGSKGYKECPFDGNSGTGNDWICCNPVDPSQNVTPNGCDPFGCCEIDLNQNGTGEHVTMSGTCAFVPNCGISGKLGCTCTSKNECDADQFCVLDDDIGPGFCSLCNPCTVDVACNNPCDCGETCFGGFKQPVSVCGGGGGGGTPTCPDGVTTCPVGNECNTAANEICYNGCCFATCPEGVTPCQISSDCPAGSLFICVTGCCIQSV